MPCAHCLGRWSAPFPSSVLLPFGPCHAPTLRLESQHCARITCWRQQTVVLWLPSWQLLRPVQNHLHCRHHHFGCIPYCVSISSALGREWRTWQHRSPRPPLLWLPNHLWRLRLSPPLQPPTPSLPPLSLQQRRVQQGGVARSPPDRLATWGWWWPGRLPTRWLTAVSRFRDRIVDGCRRLGPAHCCWGLRMPGFPVSSFVASARRCRLQMSVVVVAAQFGVYVLIHIF
mmetsp:Transcript_11090/g.27690  ORF Transcript_11090/g.27690 Transcript_11090/m.27690 type:complete len:229 (+) Transcript_11090:2521-3207(+)